MAESKSWALLTLVTYEILILVRNSAPCKMFSMQIKAALKAFQVKFLFPLGVGFCVFVSSETCAAQKVADTGCGITLPTQQSRGRSRHFQISRSLQWQHLSILKHPTSCKTQLANVLLLCGTELLSVS